MCLRPELGGPIESNYKKGIRRDRRAQLNATETLCMDDPACRWICPTRPTSNSTLARSGPGPNASTSTFHEKERKEKSWHVHLTNRLLLCNPHRSSLHDAEIN
jgi:hypothetical protein